MNVIPLEGFHERFRHPVGLRALDWRSAGQKSHARGERPHLMGHVRRSVVGQPFDLMGNAIH